MPSNGTHIAMILSDKDVPNKWRAWITSETNKTIDVAISTPNDCPVAKWTFRVDIVKKDDKGKTKVVRSKKSQTVYTVCNPWNKG